MYKSKKAWMILLALVVAIKIFSLFPAAVENYYSNGIYILISRTQRFLFGWIPFSIGDILYLLTAIYLIVQLVRIIKTGFQKKADHAFWWNAGARLIFFALMIYALFNLLWGLNYNRLGTTYQMHLQLKPYRKEELYSVLQVILERIDSSATPALVVRNNYLRKQPLFEEAYQSYQAASTRYTQLVYRTKSIKPSLFSYLGDYMGYTGYYNPFSGEAQVNTTVPIFLRPFTTCHEMGHQLGYAKEDEANFAGYLSVKSSPDPAFRYSVYFDLYSYGIRELNFMDSAAAKSLHRLVHPQVKKDFSELSAFYDRYQNPVEPYIRRLYGQYLRANEQPSGMMTYSEVMAFLVAYYKKYGKEAL